MPTKVGKKVIRAAMAILDGPMPNQTIASGAGATIGTEARWRREDDAGERRESARQRRDQDASAAAERVAGQRLAERVESASSSSG